MKQLLKEIVKKAFAAVVIFPLGTVWDFGLYLRYLVYRVRSALGLTRLEVYPSEVNERSTRVCVFAFFQENGISPSLLIHMKAVRELGYSILAVSNGALSEAERAQILELAFELVVRENQGRDFGAYKLGVLREMDRPGLERLMLTNDSVFCPLHPLPPIVEAMEAQENDFWGLNDNWEYKYHIASFFLVFKPSAFRHAAFGRFWRGYRERSSRRHSIKRGEIGLTRTLVQSGLRPGVFCGSSALVRRINTLELSELLSLSHSLSGFLDRRLAALMREFSELAGTRGGRQPAPPSLLESARNRLAKALSCELERCSPPHWAALLLNGWLGYPLFKKDVIYRGCYDFGFAVANLATTTNFPLQVIEVETRAKGSPRNLGVIKRLLLYRGYI